jgi:hypothetical protein
MDDIISLRKRAFLHAAKIQSGASRFREGSPGPVASLGGERLIAREATWRFRKLRLAHVCPPVDVKERDPARFAPVDWLCDTVEEYIAVLDFAVYLLRLEQIGTDLYTRTCGPQVVVRPTKLVYGSVKYQKLYQRTQREPQVLV